MGFQALFKFVKCWRAPDIGLLCIVFACPQWAERSCPRSSLL